MISDDLTILETTLRDGNYLVDFQFTAGDTAWLAGELEACGIHYIEIGHGLGLGASAVHHAAAASDEEYIDAAKGALRTAKIGMFAIPGVATLDHIAMAADHGLDFVRIGANADRAAEMEPFVGEARRRGMFVCTNFMKSYCLEPEAFAAAGKMAENFGSQMNYLVDSAGGMLPKDVRRYCDALVAMTSVPIGYHGHDNIRLAIANSLVAAECGARFIDTTLFGIGRGSGNAATELMVALLKQRYNLLDEVDELRLLKLAERETAPLLHHRHQETISMSMGLAQVHSMYLNRILQHSVEAGIDPIVLIRETGRIDRLEVNKSILEQASRAARAGQESLDLGDGGLLSLPAPGACEAMVGAAENLAEKLGVPCHLWVVDRTGPLSVTVERTPLAVEIRVRGNSGPALAALSRPVSRVMVTPALADHVTSLHAMTARPVELARHAPTWLNESGLMAPSGKAAS